MLTWVVVLHWVSCLIKAYRSQNFAVGYKMELLGQGVFLCKDKTNSNFAVKGAERSNRSFFAYLMNHPVQTSVLLNM